MSSSNKHIRYTDSEACLQKETFVRYLEGKLPSEEHALVAQHLENCDFCSEALEGAALINDPAKFKNIISDINSSVGKKARTKPNFLLPKIAAAAVVLVLLTVGVYGYLNFNKAESEMMYAQNFNKYPDMFNMDSVMNKLSPVKEETLEEPAPHIVAPQEMEVVEDAMVREEVAAIRNNVNQKFSAASPPPPAQSSKPEADIDAVTTNRSARSMTETEQKISTASENANIETDRIFESAMSYYDQNQYNEAVALFDLIKEENKYIAPSLLYTGISYLQLGRPTDAINNFDRLLELKNNDLEEVALWYKALSLIKLNNTKEAKAILKKVIGLNGLYKERAEDLRRSL